MLYEKKLKLQIKPLARGRYLVFYQQLPPPENTKAIKATGGGLGKFGGQKTTEANLVVVFKLKMMKKPAC